MSEFWLDAQKTIFRKAESLWSPLHIHNTVELVYAKAGGVNFVIGKNNYLVEPGEFVLVFPNQAHNFARRIRRDQEHEYISIEINPSALGSLSDTFYKMQPKAPIFHPENGNDGNIAELIEMAYDEFRQEGGGIINDAYLTLIFAKILKFYELEKRQVTDNTLMEILKFCSQHYKDNISVNDISEQLYVSRSQISYVFKTNIGMGFCEYINHLRINDATEMLKNGNRSITAIATFAGFPTIRTFNRVFYDRYGITPSEFRKNYKNRQ